MRRIPTLDDDLAGLLKRRALEVGVTFREAVNSAVRAGLGGAAAVRPQPAPKTVPHSFGFRPGVDLDKLGQLADEMEAEGFAVVGFVPRGNRGDWIGMGGRAGLFANNHEPPSGRATTSGAQRDGPAGRLAGFWRMSISRNLPTAISQDCARSLNASGQPAT